MIIFKVLKRKEVISQKKKSVSCEFYTHFFSVECRQYFMSVRNPHIRFLQWGNVLKNLYHKKSQFKSVLDMKIPFCYDKQKIFTVFSYQTLICQTSQEHRNELLALCITSFCSRLCLPGGRFQLQNITQFCKVR